MVFIITTKGCYYVAGVRSKPVGAVPPHVTILIPAQNKYFHDLEVVISDLAVYVREFKFLPTIQEKILLWDNV